MYASYMCGDYAGTGPHFRGGTLTEHLASQEPVNMTLYFRWVGEPGYQHTYTRVYGYDGQLLDTVPTGWINASGSAVVSSDTFPVHGVAEYLEQPTLTVDIEVEDNVVPAAVAGHYEFPKPDGCAGARKNYTYAIDNPDPEPDTPTELIAVSLNRNDGFVLKSWTGNCAYFDANGNYLGMLPKSVPDDPDDWITDDTIYVKCLEANPTQMASAMTGMAVLAGATAEGGAQTLLAPISAWLFAQVQLAPNPNIGRENGAVSSFDQSQEDQLLLAKAGFNPDVHDISRWVKTASPPGEIFKLLITSPSELATFNRGLCWDWSKDNLNDYRHIKDTEPHNSVARPGVDVHDVCYVETLNEYVATNPPIGLLYVKLRGAQNVLKTIVVDYGEVKEYPLTVAHHSAITHLTVTEGKEILRRVTEEIFLLDSHPQNAGQLKLRYDDLTDVNCPIALSLDAWLKFEDTDVEDPPRDPLGYVDINTQDEANDLTSAWEDGFNRSIDIVIVRGILHRNVNGLAWPNGFGVDFKSIYIETMIGGQPYNINDFYKVLAHEFGHYGGGLDDLYLCANCRNVIGQCAQLPGCGQASATNPQCPGNLMNVPLNDRDRVDAIQGNTLK